MGMSEPTASPHGRAASAFASTVRTDARVDVERVLLFGSAARGETRGRDSDVDLLVVVEDATRETVATLRRIAYDVGLEHGVTLSVHVRTSRQYENRDDSLSLSVREGGIAL